MSIKELVVGGLITLVIGGTAYTIDQADVARNLAADTGMTESMAAEYVEGVNPEDMVPFDEIGNDYIEDGNFIIGEANQIDCINYTYEWETTALSCSAGKRQLLTLGEKEVATGRAYLTLSLSTAARSDISSAIVTISELNEAMSAPIILALYAQADVNEIKTTNSYNKALLQSALDSSQ